jgi:hypothetical protein
VTSVLRKKLAILTLLLVAVAAYCYFWYATRGKHLPSWDSSAIKATYVSIQLREIDPETASLFLSYDLQNNTDFDYHLANGLDFVIMSRLISDGSLSSQEDIGLSYPTFLSARQRARVTLQVGHVFSWPAADDPALEDKLRDEVNQRLGEVDGFVLFDQTDRCQIEFPRVWEEFKLASAIK